MPYGVKVQSFARLLVLLKDEGIKYTLLLILTYPRMPWNRYFTVQLAFYIRKLMGSNKVHLNQGTIEMRPFVAERAVEIPLSIAFLQNYGADEILEVGNVLKHYGKFYHSVVDKYEKWDGLINEDILQFSPSRKYKCIISISTIEHIGFDEEPKDQEKIKLTILKLYNDLLEDGGKMLLTFPLGYNPTMDRIIDDQLFANERKTFFKHLKRFNQWVRVDGTPSGARYVYYRHFLEYFCAWEIFKDNLFED